jgi:hypothetical protein
MPGLSLPTEGASISQPLPYPSPQCTLHQIATNHRHNPLEGQRLGKRRVRLEPKGQGLGTCSRRKIQARCHRKGPRKSVDDKRHANLQPHCPPLTRQERTHCAAGAVAMMPLSLTAVPLRTPLRYAGMGVIRPCPALGEQKTNMLGLARYGAAARVSGKCDDAGAAEAVEAFFVHAESSHGARQLRGDAAEMPTAWRNTAFTAHHAGTRDAVESFVELAEVRALPEARQKLQSIERLLD